MQQCESKCDSTPISNTEGKFAVLIQFILKREKWHGQHYCIGKTLYNIISQTVNDFLKTIFWLVIVVQ